MVKNILFLAFDYIEGYFFEKNQEKLTTKRTNTVL